MTIVLLLAAWIALLALRSQWGPGNHLEFESRVHRRRRETLPTAVAKLIDDERPAYQYGNIAADIISFKAFGGHYNHCHRWTIVETMRERAQTPTDQAFILGYLSHLAADTIAHNHFVPYHLARYARGRQLGHLYWEMNADRFVDPSVWKVVSDLKARRELASLDELVNSSVPSKALSMGTNKMIFNHLLLSSERASWRTQIERLHPRSQLRLDRKFLRMFQDAAVERIRLALSPGGIAKLAHIDTNGKDAQKRALALRRGAVREWAMGSRRPEELRSEAARFLDGMQSPPPKSKAGSQPVWDSVRSFKSRTAP